MAHQVSPANCPPPPPASPCGRALAVALAALLALVAALWPGPAAATSAADANRTSYVPDFFAAANPVTALDMIRRLPGFTLDPGTSARGLAGTSGNILIDGRYPTSRTESLEAILRRIPASDVAGIELIRGSAAGIDLRGQQVVANVVRRRTHDVWAASTLAIAYRDGSIQPQLIVEAGASSARSSLDGSLSLYRATGDERRGRITFFDAGGRPTEDRLLANRYRNEGVDVSARGETRTGRGDRLAANVSYSGSRSFSDVMATERIPAIPSPDWRYRSDSRTRFAELGSEVERGLGETGTLRVNAIHTFGRTRASDDYRDPFVAAQSEASSRYEETIVRAALTQRWNPGLEVEGGAEGARNLVRQAFALTIDDAPIEIPFDTVRVGEKRAELHAEARWRPSDRLSLDLTLRWEGSRLRLRSDEEERRRSFSFLKPRLAVTWTPDEQTTLRGRIEREVRQLDFSDFVASAALDTLVIDAGNIALAPERAWRFEAGAERRFWTRGAVGLAVEHRRITNVIDYFPLAGRFDAIGNIGAGHSWRLTGSLTLPLDRLGLAGGLIRADASRRWSGVVDPVTDRRRRISGEKPYTASVRFSHDLPRLKTTWGIDFEAATSSRRYRLAEVALTRSARRLSLYVEHKPTPAWALRGEVGFGDALSLARRIIYARNRLAGSIIGVEERQTRSSASFFLSVRRSF